MSYDAIIVGGGLAGATLGKNLAEGGKSVIILEQEQTFRDRVRGEQMHPWGIAEAKRLGIYQALKESCAREVRHLQMHQAGAPPIPPRDLVESTPHAAGSLHFKHFEMQETLLDAASKAGAEIRKGIKVVAASGGNPPIVKVRVLDGATQTLSAHLVIGADGRRSAMRKWGGFEVRHEPDRLALAGVMLEGMQASAYELTVIQNFQLGTAAIIAPLGNGFFRTYAGHHKARSPDPRPLTGAASLPRFIDAAVATGAPRQWFDGAEQVGPLATFDCADTWVEHPFKDGIVLVGDAAASSDPSYGCGLSLTLRSVRLLRDHLLATEDWRNAAESYARDISEQAAALRRITGWLTELCFEPGTEADRRRARAFGRIREDPTRMPDFVGLGPDAPSDEAARSRLFAED